MGVIDLFHRLNCTIMSRPSGNSFPCQRFLALPRINTCQLRLLWYKIKRLLWTSKRVLNVAKMTMKCITWAKKGQSQEIKEASYDYHLHLVSIYQYMQTPHPYPAISAPSTVVKTCYHQFCQPPTKSQKWVITQPLKVARWVQGGMVRRSHSQDSTQGMIRISITWSLNRKEVTSVRGISYWPRKICTLTWQITGAISALKT